MVLAIIIVAAAAETTGDLIPGKVIIGLFSAIFAAGGGIWIGRKGGESAAEKTWADKEQKIRAEIASELKAKIVNDPLTVEQSSYQATMKLNAEQHADLFNRMRIVEAELAGIKATITAKFDGLSAQLMETREMVRSLYDKVCNGGRRK